MAVVQGYYVRMPGTENSTIRRTGTRMAMLSILVGYLMLMGPTMAQHQCTKFTASETLEISTSENGVFLGSVSELHIRHNIRVSTKMLLL